MGKQARIARQQRETFRRQHPAETELVDRTHQALDVAWVDLVEGCRQWTQQRRLRNGVLRQVHALKLEPSQIARWRNDALGRGTEWPSWCYYPAVLQLIALADGCDWGRSDDAVLPMASAASSIAGIGAWHAAPLVARFDDDLAAAVIATPLTGDLPFDSLRRLPAWGVVIPIPWLRADALALVWADTAQIRHPDTNIAPADETSDEMFVMLMTDNDDAANDDAANDDAANDDAAIVLRLRFSEPTIAATLAAQQIEAERDGLTNLGQTNDVDTIVADRFDTTAHDVVAKVLALALYLSSEQSDVVDSVVVEDSGHRRRSPLSTGTAVVDVGFRIGAALRAHRTRSTGDRDSLPTGIAQAPHIRSAHWHTYWFGPRSQPELRYRATRWLPPIGVNIDLDAPAPTTVRSVAPPAAPPAG